MTIEDPIPWNDFVALRKLAKRADNQTRLNTCYLDAFHSLKRFHMEVRPLLLYKLLAATNDEFGAEYTAIRRLLAPSNLAAAAEYTSPFTNPQKETPK